MTTTILIIFLALLVTSPGWGPYLAHKNTDHEGDPR